MARMENIFDDRRDVELVVSGVELKSGMQARGQKPAAYIRETGLCKPSSKDEEEGIKTCTDVTLLELLNLRTRDMSDGQPS
jgi:hypothetical protein